MEGSGEGRDGVGVVARGAGGVEHKVGEGGVERVSGCEEVVDLVERAPARKAGAVALACGEAGAEGGRLCAEVDDTGGALALAGAERVGRAGRGGRAPSECQDGAIEAEGVVEGEGLCGAEGVLSVACPGLRDGLGAQEREGLLVEVDERALEGGSDEGADGGLAGGAEADEREIGRGRCDGVEPTAGSAARSGGGEQLVERGAASDGGGQGDESAARGVAHGAGVLAAHDFEAEHAGFAARGWELDDADRAGVEHLAGGDAGAAE